MNETIMNIVNYIMGEANINADTVKVLDYDADNIYLAIDSDNNNYNIRTWNINDTCIRYSLFRFEDGYAEEVIESHCFRYAA